MPRQSSSPKAGMLRSMLHGGPAHASMQPRESGQRRAGSRTLARLHAGLLDQTEVATPEDAERAWAERFFLATSPIWIVAVAAVVIGGVLPDWGDAEYMLFACAVAAPAVLGPRLAGQRMFTGDPPRPAYWLKLNVWVAIIVVFGTYIGTAYFFDLMGMRYAFATKWSLQSPVVGKTGAGVPLFLYPLTQAYFVTYFAALSVAWRMLRTKLRLGTLGAVVSLFVLSYALAFAETFAMATDLMTDLFRYEQKDKMLLLGSFGYATYFLVGLPMVTRIDRDERWTLGRTALEACATCMMILALLELWAQVVGPL
jgi:cycloeucalenol cycloisomerase